MRLRFKSGGDKPPKSLVQVYRRNIVTSVGLVTYVGAFECISVVSLYYSRSWPQFFTVATIAVLLNAISLWLIAHTLKKLASWIRTQERNAANIEADARIEHIFSTQYNLKADDE